MEGSEFNKTTHRHESILFELFCNEPFNIFYNIYKVDIDEFDEINFDKQKLKQKLEDNFPPKYYYLCFIYIIISINK
jgi:hypothetical protein